MFGIKIKCKKSFLGRRGINGIEVVEAFRECGSDFVGW